MDSACGVKGETFQIPVTSIVLSKYDRIFDIFASAYEATCSVPLIVVDDGLSPGMRERYPHFTYVNCPQPFAFCNAVNAGIARAPDWTDVLVFNDDTIVKTPHTDMILWSASRKDPSIGILAPLMDNVQNVQQHPENKVAGEELIITEKPISFTVVYIARRLIKEIGLLDPGFAVGIGGAEDRDYCLRARKGGYKLAVVQGAFVQHGGEEFGRRISNTRFGEGQLEKAVLNREYFNEKHCVS